MMYLDLAMLNQITSNYFILSTGPFLDFIEQPLISMRYPLIHGMQIVQNSFFFLGCEFI